MAETLATNKASDRKSLKLRYFAILREQRGLLEETLSSAAQTPLELYEELTKLHGFTLPSNRIQVAVNDQFSAMDIQLKEGDAIVFVPPVAGG
jgi:molybdopterin converting factor subunit 1